MGYPRHASFAGQGDAVVAEGTVRTKKRDGAEVRLRFCDVFVMETGKIKQLISYLTDFKESR